MSDAGTADNASVAAATAATTAQSWLEGKPAEFIGTLENRGVKDKPADEVALHFYEAHRNAAQALSKFGATDPNRILAIPKDEADEKGWSDFYGKLRPSKFEEYGIEGDDAKEFAETAFELGLTKGQAAKLRALEQEGKKAAGTEAATKATEMQEALRKEENQLKINWGPNYDDNTQLSLKGLKEQYGFTPEQVAEFRKQPGFAKLLEGGLRYAQAIGEDKYTGGEGQAGPRSYEQAKASYAELMRNPRGPEAMAYTDPNNPRHTEVKKEVLRIQTIIANYEARQKQDWGIAV